MSKLGIYHWTYNNRSAVDASIASFRKFYPSAPYFLACDGGPDHYDICKKYNVEYYHSTINLGYPAPVVGYNKHQIYEFCRRIYLACIVLDCTHLVISEDDVHCLNTISFDSDLEFAGYGFPLITPNKMSKELLNYCEQVSGIKPNCEFYGVGAGSIINTKTYIKYFGLFSKFLNNNFDKLHASYPQLGWNDCFLHTFFMLAGKLYTTNPRMYNNHPENPNIDLIELGKNYDTIHYYKNFYESRLNAER